jgi:hypothetical protein
MIRILCFHSRDNFLRIDLYFSELSYELIQQMPAYTIFDLLSKF